MPKPCRSWRHLSRGAGAAVLVLAEVAAVVVLFRLGHRAGFAAPTHAFGRWIRAEPTEVLVAALGRLAGLTLGAWLLGTTLLSMARRLVPAWRSVRALDLATPPSVRRLLDRTLAVGLGASLAITAVRPAAAAPSRPIAVGGRAGSAASSADVPVPRVPPVSTPRAPRPTVAPRASPKTAPTQSSGTVVVRPGDNLWVIARRAVRSDDPATIAPYWRAVVAANAPTLRSRDPNLIYPGERIRLPAGPPSRTTDPPG